MFIWGTKRRERKVGYVADFCPICRELRPFQLVAINMVSHVYWIPLGRGQIVGHIEICQECGIKLKADPTAFIGTVKNLPTGFDQLVANTYPNIYAAYGNRLKMEDRVRSNPWSLDTQDRLTLIRESFTLAANVLESKFAGATEIDLLIGMSLLLTVAMPMLILILAHSLPAYSKLHEYVGTAIWISTIGGVSALIYSMATAKRRYIKSELLPLLCRALGPLKPSSNEIESVLSGLRSMHFRLPDKLAARSVVAALESYGTPTVPTGSGVVGGANVRRRISAGEIAADIKQGLSKDGLKQKYSLSQSQLEKIISRLIDAGHISPHTYPLCEKDRL
jgi:hypothetical protein